MENNKYTENFLNSIAKYLLEVDKLDVFELNPDNDSTLFKEIDISNNLDVLLEVRSQKENSVNYPIYSVYNRVYYSSLGDEKLINRIEKITQNQSSSENALSLNGAYNIIFYEDLGETEFPQEWINFLKSYYGKFCNIESDIRYIIEFVLLSLSASFQSMPYLQKGIDNSIILGYSNTPLSLEIQPLVVASTIDKDFIKELKNKKEDKIKITGYDILTNQIEIVFFPDDVFEMFEEVGVNMDKTLVFDILFVFEHFNFIKETNTLIFILYRALINNVLYFPCLSPSFSNITQSIKQEYSDIVNKEYKKILYYILTRNARKGMIYNMIVKNLIEIKKNDY